ncbi:RRQRL motif-containing zinc-binding protein [Streptomyces sp. NPDC015501]|uniref:RRQRL motif-containing zinc-binding protein n=1 Tax=unclassified Streptomyces TaxID=2593676 RepID=UPI003702B6D5
MRPGGQEPVARTECHGGKRFAWLYRIDLAKPKLPMTLAKEAALDRAMAQRQTCPGPCGRRYFHCLTPAHRGLLRPLRPGIRTLPRHLLPHHRADHTPLGRLTCRPP